MRIREAKGLETGKWYKLYKIPSNATGTAVVLKRKLVSHHPNIARFANKYGSVECFTYAQLAGMLRKPDPGIKIIKEESAERNLAQMEGKRR